MAFKKIRDLDASSQLPGGSLSKDDLLAAADVNGSKTVKVTPEEIIGTSLGSGSSLELDSNGKLKVKEESITTDELASTGQGAISITNIQPKTIVVHVGNYYLNGIKYWASDAYNYNSSTDIYESRNVTTNLFKATEAIGVHAWSFLHYDVDEQVVIEPFATVVAAARYALQNYGTNINVTFMIHGHVAAYGTYDQNAHTFKDINNFDSFAKVALVGAAPGSYSGADSEYTNFGRNGDTPGRIDFDQAPRAGGSGGYSLAWWFRGPVLRVVGTNQVFHNSSATPSNMEVRYGIGLNHDIANNRMASVGNISFFNPYAFLEGTIGYFSSGSNNPNEFYFAKGGRCFDVSATSRLVYSNNGVNHVYIDGADTASHHISLAAVYEGSTMEFKNAGTNVFYRSGKTYLQWVAPSYPIYLAKGFCTFNTHVTGNVFVGESGIGNDEAANGVGYYMTRDYQSGGISTNAAHRKTYASSTSSGAANASGTLYNRYDGSSYESSKSTLNAERLCGNDAPISAPTTRTGTGGTNSTNAPYANQ